MTIKTMIFTHWPRVSLARFTFCWWRHNWLPMTSQWPDQCGAITWIMHNVIGQYNSYFFHEKLCCTVLGKPSNTGYIGQFWNEATSITPRYQRISRRIPNVLWWSKQKCQKSEIQKNRKIRWMKFIWTSEYVWYLLYLVIFRSKWT